MGISKTNLYDKYKTLTSQMFVDPIQMIWLFQSPTIDIRFRHYVLVRIKFLLGNSFFIVVEIRESQIWRFCFQIVTVYLQKLELHSLNPEFFSLRSGSRCCRFHSRLNFQWNAAVLRYYLYIRWNIHIGFVNEAGMKRWYHLFISKLFSISSTFINRLWRLRRRLLTIMVDLFFQLKRFRTSFKSGHMYTTNAEYFGSPVKDLAKNEIVWCAPESTCNPNNMLATKNVKECSCSLKSYRDSLLRFPRNSLR